MSVIISIHRHFGELLLLLPLAVIGVALTKGKTALPRVTAVLLDIQFVLGLVTLFMASKVVSGLHLVCMTLALGLAHAFAKKDNAKAVAGAFGGVFALLVLGYLFQKGVLPNGGWFIAISSSSAS